ncbi:BTB/POZ and MATH domain-containing protein 2-like [Hordeum vulgare subsp. vulgare]|uniref:Uncharacterized protein n=1 Tax=Hordeum vulgare subsp. vulgare TaxID=112509 RepID=A0A8I6X354_HORVV|nr:BTB/POZ and MATH domain-containing protein 2-like [Hordeum vulgare subsp. vulgare]
MGCAMSSSFSTATPPSAAADVKPQTVSPRSGSHVLLLYINAYAIYQRLGNGKCVKSETFLAGGRRWYVEFYPDGHGPRDAGWISLFLFLVQAGAYEVVTTQLKISLLDTHGKPVPSYGSRGAWRSCTFSSNEGPWGYSRLITRADLERLGHVSSENGGFSVQFDIIVSDESSTEYVPGRNHDRMLVPPPDILHDLGKLLSSGEGVDVTFEVGGETFAAHRCILGARSFVFRAELLGPMKESTSTCVQIEDMEPKVFKALLHFIYTDSLPEIDEAEALGMIQHLLVAADRYGLKRLKLTCEEKLCSYFNTSTVATTLALAEQHACPALKEECLRFLESSNNSTLDLITRSSDFEHLATSCPSIMKELIPKLARKPPFVINYSNM